MVNQARYFEAIMDDILTTKEAAALLKIMPATLLRMVNAGEIPATKLGDDWRFVKAQLIQLFATKATTEQNVRKAMDKPTAQPTQRGRGRPRKNAIDLSSYQ